MGKISGGASVCIDQQSEAVSAWSRNESIGPLDLLLEGQLVKAIHRRQR